MSINYAVRKKIDKTGEEEKVLYYAVNRALQGKGKGVTGQQLAQTITNQSSLMKGDVLSVFSQLPDVMAHYLKQGRTVTIEGLGTFYPSVTSEGYETPEECTADKVWVNRVCFRSDASLISNIRKAKFFNLEFTVARSEKKKSRKAKE
ncbi:MAG: HU family DNA-binding protein [Bacteroides sp.]|nr:HU family DNA-binding protein [Bacteroides sp.]